MTATGPADLSPTPRTPKTLIRVRTIIAKSRISSVDDRLSSSAVGNCACGIAGTGEKQSLGCLREFNGEAGSFAVRASGGI